MQENNVAEITTGNVKEFMTSFFGEEFGINVANPGKMVGGAALLSIASQIVVSSATERFPEMAKDVVKKVVNGFVNAGKKLFKGNIFGAAGSVIGGVAKGAVSIVKGVAKGAVSAVKTVGKTIGKVGKAIGKGVKKLFKGW